MIFQAHLALYEDWCDIVPSVTLSQSILSSFAGSHTFSSSSRFIRWLNFIIARTYPKDLQITLFCSQLFPIYCGVQVDKVYFRSLLIFHGVQCHRNRSYFPNVQQCFWKILGTTVLSFYLDAFPRCFEFLHQPHDDRAFDLTILILNVPQGGFSSFLIVLIFREALTDKVYFRSLTIFHEAQCHRNHQSNVTYYQQCF